MDVIELGGACCTGVPGVEPVLRDGDTVNRRNRAALTATVAGGAVAGGSS